MISGRPPNRISPISWVRERICNRGFIWRPAFAGPALRASGVSAGTSPLHAVPALSGTTLVNGLGVTIARAVNRHEHQPSIAAANEWFDALDQRVLGRGTDRWTAAVLRVHGDDQDWWIDIATAANPAANVVLRLSRQATVFHAVAALRRHRPRTVSCAPVIDVVQVG
jgi:hypothetical protein